MTWGTCPWTPRRGAELCACLDVPGVGRISVASRRRLSSVKSQEAEKRFGANLSGPCGAISSPSHVCETCLGVAGWAWLEPHLGSMRHRQRVAKNASIRYCKRRNSWYPDRALPESSNYRIIGEGESRPYRISIVKVTLSRQRNATHGSHAQNDRRNRGNFAVIAAPLSSSRTLSRSRRGADSCDRGKARRPWWAFSFNHPAKPSASTALLRSQDQGAAGVTTTRARAYYVDDAAGSWRNPALRPPGRRHCRRGRVLCFPEGRELGRRRPDREEGCLAVDRVRLQPRARVGRRSEGKGSPRTFWTKGCSLPLRCGRL